MKSHTITTTVLIVLFSLPTFAQIGINTVTPHSSLHVKGSLANSYQSFTGDITASGNNSVLVFTGSSAATVSLPAAAGCKGRHYMVKNMAVLTPAPLRLLPATGETIEGLLSWTLDETGQAITIVSNGTNWQVSAIFLPSLSAGLNWSQNGNNVSSSKFLGTLTKSLDA